VKGVENVRMLVNFLLLRGNIGKPGAGPTPVRGHSNVQGQRTVGITEKTELAPVDKLRELYGFEPPSEKGLDTVETCRGVIDGSVRAVIGLGGNFLRAVPETQAMARRAPRTRSPAAPPTHAGCRVGPPFRLRVRRACRSCRFSVGAALGAATHPA
jgi:anaerobic selenocysteine-containing dehydrogenase